MRNILLAIIVYFLLTGIVLSVSPKLPRTMQISVTNYIFQNDKTPVKSKNVKVLSNEVKPSNIVADARDEVKKQDSDISVSREEYMNRLRNRAEKQYGKDYLNSSVYYSGTEVSQNPVEKAQTDLGSKMNVKHSQDISDNKNYSNSYVVANNYSQNQNESYAKDEPVNKQKAETEQNTEKTNTIVKTKYVYVPKYKNKIVYRPVYVEKPDTKYVYVDSTYYTGGYNKPTTVEKPCKKIKVNSYGRPQTMNNRPKSVNTRPTVVNNRPSTDNTRPIVVNNRPATVNNRPTTTNNRPSSFTEVCKTCS